MIGNRPRKNSDELWSATDLILSSIDVKFVALPTSPQISHGFIVQVSVPTNDSWIDTHSWLIGMSLFSKGTPSGLGKNILSVDVSPTLSAKLSDSEQDDALLLAEANKDEDSRLHGCNTVEELSYRLDQLSEELLLQETDPILRIVAFTGEVCSVSTSKTSHTGCSLIYSVSILLNRHHTHISAHIPSNVTVTSILCTK